MALCAAAFAAEDKKKADAVMPKEPMSSVTATFTVTEADGNISAERDSSAGKGFFNLLDPSFVYGVGDEVRVTITLVKKGNGKTAGIAHREGDPTCTCKYCKEERASTAKIKAVLDAGLPDNGAPVDPKKLKELLLQLAE